MNVVQMIITACTSAGFFAFLQFLITRYDNRKDTPERIMLRALGSERLYDLLTDWKHADERPASRWKLINEMYHGYKALDGNGEIEKLYEECKDIETTD